MRDKLYFGTDTKNIVKNNCVKEGEVINSFKYLLKEIEEDIDIPFRVKNLNGEIIIDLLGYESKKTIKDNLEIKDNKFIIETSIEFKNCIGLLRYCIKEKLKDFFKSKEDIIEEIISGKIIANTIAESTIVSIPNNIILIDKISNKDENFNILLKNNKKIGELVISINDSLVILVEDNNLEVYLNYIRENKLDRKYYITYGRISGLLKLKEKFDYLKENINLCIKYKLKENLYKENGLILERALESINELEKKKIYNDYNKKLLKLDDDLIKTINIFFQEDLNVNNTSKRLFIHRNTLLYRINKIRKIIDYDITNFKEATEFKIIFNIWKSNKNKEI